MTQADIAIFDQLYGQLNKNQKLAVDTIEGPVTVQAGPGTGKTQVLTLRIANIMRIQGSDMADRILALTFTNAGVSAMRSRLASIIGSDAYRVNIFTFHSLSEHVIKNHSDYFLDHLESTALTDTERLQIAEHILTSGDYNIMKPFGAKTFYVKTALAAVDELKRDAFTPESFLEWNEEYKVSVLADEDSYYKRNGKGFSKGDLKKDVLKSYEKNLELGKFYTDYQQQLVNNKKYDYTDMIILANNAIESNPDLLYDLQEQYQYILLDEHQDTNTAQNHLVSLLANAEHLNGRPNLFTVGDDKQAIYRFQGASIENFTNFETAFSDVVTVSLQDNYRSGQSILDNSHELISANSQREHTKLESHSSDATVSVDEFIDYETELDFVASKIAELEKTGVSYGEMAILYRENKNTIEIKKALGQHSIPSVVMAREDILHTPLAQKLLLLLRVINNLHDNASVTKLLYSDLFNIHPYDVTRIISETRKSDSDKNIFSLISNKETIASLDLKTDKAIFECSEKITDSITLFENDSFLPALDRVMHKIGFMSQMLADVNSQQLLSVYDRLYQEFKKVVASNQKSGVNDILKHIDTLEDYGVTIDAPAQDHLDGVRLLTAHGSKGLEYEYVFVTNLVDKVWGNKKRMKQFSLPTMFSSGDNDDERRLLYVAMTRAKKGAYLTYAQTGSDGRVRDPSMFLYDVPEYQNVLKHTTPIELSHKHKPVAVFEHSIFNDDFIQKIFLKRPLSVTALNNYLDCPGRYFVNNLLQVPASYSRSLVYGSVIHAALEKFFTRSKTHKKLLGVSDLLDAFTAELSRQYLSQQEHADLLQKGLESLTNYYEQQIPHMSIDIDTEFRIPGVNFTLETGDIWVLTGALDKIEYTENDNHVIVHDYKTGKPFSEKNKEQKIALERQIAFYKLLLSLHRDGMYQMDSGVLDFVEASKKGEMEQHSIVVSQQQSSELCDSINQIHREVQEGVSFLDKRCNKPDCDACQLLKILN